MDYKVNVWKTSLGKCYVKKCKARKVRMIFGWDGSPIMSRFAGQFCKKHLEKGINRAWKLNNKLKELK